MSLNSVKNITVIGLGLIGGSFAKAVRESGVVDNVYGYDVDDESVLLAEKIGVVDKGFYDIGESVRGSDVVVIAVPLGKNKMVLRQIKDFVGDNCIISDAGSSKASVIQDAKEVFGELPVNFVPAHPISGKEKSGVLASDSELFIGRKLIITPTDKTSEHAVSVIEDIWSSIGANVEKMEASMHDEIFGATSHMPHVIAFSLMNMMNSQNELDNVFDYTGGGFRDFTRIASSSPEMWRDITLNNKDFILKWVEMFRDELNDMINIIQSADGDKIFDIYKKSKEVRDEKIVKRESAICRVVNKDKCGK